MTPSNPDESYSYSSGTQVGIEVLQAIRIDSVVSLGNKRRTQPDRAICQTQTAIGHRIANAQGQTCAEQDQTQATTMEQRHSRAEFGAVTS